MRICFHMRHPKHKCRGTQEIRYRRQIFCKWETGQGRRPEKKEGPKPDGGVQWLTPTSHSGGTLTRCEGDWRKEKPKSHLKSAFVLMCKKQDILFCCFLISKHYSLPFFAVKTDLVTVLNYHLNYNTVCTKWWNPLFLSKGQLYHGVSLNNYIFFSFNRKEKLKSPQVVTLILLKALIWEN